MGLIWSKPEESDTMDEEREPPPPPDEQQTTWDDASDSASARQSDTPTSSDNSGELSDVWESDPRSSGEENAADAYDDFEDAVEPHFAVAENALRCERLDAASAKRLVLTLRDIAQRFGAEGCQHERLERCVVQRALVTADQLIDGVNSNNEEVFDPRQTTAYLYCAMAVFQCSVKLKKDQTGTVVYRFSALASQCFPLMDELERFSAIKTQCEGTQGRTNLLTHYRLLTDLAAWLEPDRPPLAHMIANRNVTSLSILKSAARSHPSLPGLSSVTNMLDMNVVVMASAFVRSGFVSQARDIRKLLVHVDESQLPPFLAGRHAYVHSVLLQDCGEYAKALILARAAAAHITERRERLECERLITDITVAMETEEQRRHSPSPVDLEWLEGTQALTIQNGRNDQEEARQRHLSQQARQKQGRTKAVKRRGETPSPQALLRQRQAAQTSTPARHARSSSLPPSSLPSSSLSAPSLPSLHPWLAVSLGPAIPAVCRKGDGSQRAAHSEASPAPSSTDRFSSGEDSDDDSADDDDDTVDFEREIRYDHINDADFRAGFIPDGDSPATDSEAGLDAMTAAPHSQDGRDWFEYSQDALGSGEADEEEEAGIELSARQEEAFKKGGRGDVFYKALFHGAEAEELMKRDPKKFVRCQIKIERAHKSIAKVLDAGCKHQEILIEGRSKANQTFNDDEVVVEITALPGTSRGLGVGRGTGGASGGQEGRGGASSPWDQGVEKMPHGKVVGLLRRHNYRAVAHPVLFCTLDELEGHLMRPLCRTVPKVHVINDRVKKRFPALQKNRVQVSRVRDGEVVHAGFLSIHPDKREQYVFRVAVLAWRPQNIYPLGAVLGWHVGGRDYDGGLQVLSMQQRVPRLYPRAALTDTEHLLQTPPPTAGRDDLRDLRVFTIDPPGSRDLDDAISVQQRGPHYVIGVHISDVAAVVRKDSGVDVEAKRRAVTFYALQRKPHAMLPEPLSHGRCSLLPGQLRPALSVFFTLDQAGRQVEEPDIRKTVIRSCRQLTYEEAQRIIEGKDADDVDPGVQGDIRQLHALTSQLKQNRQQQSALFVPFEDPRLTELERIAEHEDAHSLVEELMIRANHSVAKYLKARPRYRHALLVRCHAAPSWEDLRAWRDREGPVTDLVMALQGKAFTPTQDRVSFRNEHDVLAENRQPVVLQREVWGSLTRLLEEGAVSDARRLAFSDALHPLQCLARNAWMDLMETARYRCYSALTPEEARHFGLDLDVYTHFTSPIRRYADLYVQRLLHAALDSTAPDSTPDDVTALCAHLNSASSRQKAFGKGCMSLRLSEGLQRQPLLFRAYVDTVDKERLTVCVPSLLTLPERRQELPFSMLGVSSQPDLVTDTALRRDIVTVTWTKRVYDAGQTCHGSLLAMWRHLERQERPGGRAVSAAVTMTLRPDMHSVAVKRRDWVAILHALSSHGGRAPPEIQRERQAAENRAIALLEIPRERQEVEHMSCEKGDGRVALRPVQFNRRYFKGQVVHVQLSAEPKRGVLQPRAEVFHTARNTSVCTQHATDPVSVLTRHATRATRGYNFNSCQDYVQAWMPLLEMEAATDAGDNDAGAVIENLAVTIRTQGASNSLKYRGYFSLGANFCSDRCVEFGGRGADSVRQDEFLSDSLFALDYLCLRYSTRCSDLVASRVAASGMAETVDRSFTWLAHGSVAQVIRQGRKAEGGGNVVVTFVLSPSSPPPPPQLMSSEGAKVTVEILPKSDVDRRAQEMLLLLKEPEYELAQAIAFGSKIPKLDAAHRKLGKKDVNHEVNVPNVPNVPNPRRLPVNNPPQLKAIQMAMTNSLTIIQGPPGSGKTNTGIKLVYLFSKINKQLEAEGKGRKTVLYCGPSNKAVDLVARELKSKLGALCPKLIRMYGSVIESKDYPVPRDGLRTTRGLRDLKCDPDLQDVALHHVIRQDGKPFAAKLAEFEKFFQKCRTEPDKHSVSNKNLKDYKQLIFEASVEELKHCQVILATCAVGGSRRLLKGTSGDKEEKTSIFQLIIDECGMCPEPHSMVPIIATRARQVVLIGDHKQLRPIIKCQAAAELGLDQSLFERLFQKFPAFTVFLSTQYRMHPEICEFPSKEFYDQQLVTGYSSLWGENLLPFWPLHPLIPKRQVPHLLVDVRGVEEELTVNTDQGNERSKSNSLEADKVIEILTFLKKYYEVDMLKVKILTQYNAQRHELVKKIEQAIEHNRDVFRHYDKLKVNVSTVVSSQGGEWDYVILSTVRSLPTYLIEPNPTHGWCRQNLGFITDRNQVNVALTRARRGLFIVGNTELLKCDDVWRRLVERYERLGCCVEDFPPPPVANPRANRHRARHNANNDWQRA